MGEGLGAGGHSTRRRLSNAPASDRFRGNEIIFSWLPFRSAGGGVTGSHLFHGLAV